MGFRTHDRKTFIADACRDFTERHITKRDFLRKTAHAGIGFSAFATTFLGKGRPFGALSSQRHEPRGRAEPAGRREVAQGSGRQVQGHEDPLLDGGGAALHGGESAR